MLKKIISVWLFAVSAIAMGQENLAADINESVFKLSTTVKSAYNAVYTRDMTVRYRAISGSCDTAWAKSN